MKHNWSVSRDTVLKPDGQGRWDRAYQLLLRWADDALMSSQPDNSQEDDDADRDLCSCLDQSPAANSYD